MYVSCVHCSVSVFQLSKKYCHVVFLNHIKAINDDDIYEISPIPESRKNNV